MFDTLLLQAASYHKTWDAVPIDFRLRLCTEYGRHRLWEMFTETDDGPEALLVMCQNLSADDDSRAQSHNQLILTGLLTRYFGEEVRIRFEYQQQQLELETA